MSDDLIGAIEAVRTAWAAADPALELDLADEVDEAELSELMALSDGRATELYAWLRLHDGTGFSCSPIEPQGWTLSSCESIISTWKMYRDEIVPDWLASGIGPEADPDNSIGPAKALAWSSLWIPFGDDGGGNMLLVDLDPDHGGIVGQIIHWDSGNATKEVIAPSIKAWLIGHAAKVSSGAITWDSEGEEWVAA